MIGAACSASCVAFIASLASFLIAISCCRIRRDSSDDMILGLRSQVSQIGETEKGDLIKI
jgi:hypothetical protein